nr:MAG TPA: hypothetical protein [Caudoviricetes sp.]
MRTCFQLSKHLISTASVISPFSLAISPSGEQMIFSLMSDCQTRPSIISLPSFWATFSRASSSRISPRRAAEYLRSPKRST